MSSKQDSFQQKIHNLIQVEIDKTEQNDEIAIAMELKVIRRDILAVWASEQKAAQQKLQEKLDWIRGVPSDFVAKCSVIKSLEELLGQ